MKLCNSCVQIYTSLGIWTFERLYLPRNTANLLFIPNDTSTKLIELLLSHILYLTGNLERFQYHARGYYPSGFVRFLDAP